MEAAMLHAAWECPNFVRELLSLEGEHIQEVSVLRANR